MPTRKPTISESARLVSSAIRAAAASVSFITCGRGRFGLAGAVVVMFVIYSFLAAHQSRSGIRHCRARPGQSIILRKAYFEEGWMRGPPWRDTSPHIQNQPRLVGHAV